MSGDSSRPVSSTASCTADILLLLARVPIGVGLSAVAEQQLIEVVKAKARRRASLATFGLATAATAAATAIMGAACGLQQIIPS